MWTWKSELKRFSAIVVVAAVGIVLMASTTKANATGYMYGVPPGVKVDHDVSGAFDDTVTFVSPATGIYNVTFEATDLRPIKVATKFKMVQLSTTLKDGRQFYNITHNPDAAIYAERGQVWTIRFIGTSAERGGSYSLLIDPQ